MKRLVACQGTDLFLIIDRPGETEWVDEARIDDTAILVDTAEGVRFLRPLWGNCSREVIGRTAATMTR